MPPPPPRPRGSVPGVSSTNSNNGYPPPPNARGDDNRHVRFSQGQHQRAQHQKQSFHHHNYSGSNGDNKKRRVQDDRGPYSRDSRPGSNENRGNKRPRPIHAPTAHAIVPSSSIKGFRQHPFDARPAKRTFQQTQRLHPQKKQQPQPPKQQQTQIQYRSAQTSGTRKSSIKSTDAKVTSRSERAERVKAQSEAFWGTESGTSGNNSVAIKSEPTSAAAKGTTARCNQEPTPGRNVNDNSRRASEKSRFSIMSTKAKPRSTIKMAAPRNEELTDRIIGDTARTSSNRPRSSTAAQHPEPHNTTTETISPPSQELMNTNKRVLKELEPEESETETESETEEPTVDPEESETEEPPEKKCLRIQLKMPSISVQERDTDDSSMTSTPNSFNQPRSSTVTIKSEAQNTPNTGVAACRNQNLDVSKMGNLDSARGPLVTPKPESETHIIFAIDFSGSMKSRDVQKGPGQQITRWDAVFECIPIILDGQCNDDGVGDNVVVSLVIFNNQAKTLLERMPLVGDGRKVQRALNTAHKKNRPSGGTGFSVGLQRAKAVASRNLNSKITLVFLSDGRPGDLQTKPPTGSQPMQPTFKENGKIYPSAAVHLEEMKHQFGNRFNLQFVCLCQQGKPVSSLSLYLVDKSFCILPPLQFLLLFFPFRTRQWLEYLANHYEGAFHMSELKMEDDDVIRPGVAVLQQQNVVGTQEEPIELGESDNDDEDILDMVVKSRETLLREKYNRALATGNVHSIAHSTTAATSMRSTFQSISSTVMAMRHGNLRERQVVLESITGTKSAKRMFEATHMVLDKKKEKFVVKRGEKVNGKKVWIAMQPFAQGGLRNVFDLGKEFGTGRLVGKESKHEIPYAQRLKFHRETSKCQDRALQYTRAFNKNVKKKSPKLKELLGRNRLHVIRAELYRINDPDSPGGFRYLSVESHIKGKYEKWNSNNGFVHESNSLQSQVAQAFR